MPDRASNRRIIVVALVLCVVCSALVTATTIALRPVQQANKQWDRQLNILRVAGLVQPGEDPAPQLARLETRLVDLELGWFSEALPVAGYDHIQAARDPAISIALDPAQDSARIHRRARYAPVYLVRDETGAIATLVLPVYGYGLWSTMYGYLALAGDLRTVVGLRFYEHAETPGLGGEVDNPRWLAQWQGKQVFDEHWQPALQVLKGRVDSTRPAAVYQVDGLSGATLSGRGVQNLLRFWLGEDGFGPLLANLRIIGEGDE